MKRNLLFVIPNMVGGGAEKAMLLLLKYFDQTKFEITLILFNKLGEYLDEVPGHIRIIDLQKRSKYDFPRLIWRLKRIIDHVKPVGILSCMTYANIISIISGILSHSLNKIFIIHQIYPGAENFSSSFHKFIRNCLYLRAAHIVAVSEGIKKSFINDFAIKESRITVINNSIEIDNINLLIHSPVEHPFLEKNRRFKTVISAGRLEPQKNHALLLEAFSTLIGRIDSRLIILGQGSLELTLRSMTKSLKIEDKVYFAGFQKNPYAWLSKSDLFVLSSDYEGFGNVIIEAMACGVPVIATDCPYGPAEIISDGINGLLVKVGDTEALVSQIEKVLSNPQLGKTLSDTAYQSIGRYDIKTIADEYAALL